MIFTKVFNQMLMIRKNYFVIEAKGLVMISDATLTIMRIAEY